MANKSNSICPKTLGRKSTFLREGLHVPPKKAFSFVTCNACCASIIQFSCLISSDYTVIMITFSYNNPVYMQINFQLFNCCNTYIQILITGCNKMELTIFFFYLQIKQLLASTISTKYNSNTLSPNLSQRYLTNTKKKSNTYSLHLPEQSMHAFL